MGGLKTLFFREAKEEHESYHKKMDTNNHARKAAVKAFIYGMEHIITDNDINSD